MFIMYINSKKHLVYMFSESFLENFYETQNFKTNSKKMFIVFQTYFLETLPKVVILTTAVGKILNF